MQNSRAGRSKASQRAPTLVPFSHQAQLSASFPVQASAPHYILLVTPLAGESRFASAAAKVGWKQLWWLRCASVRFKLRPTYV